MTADAAYSHLVSVTGFVALIFQIVATALIALLSYIIARSVQRRLMLYWSAGWASYSLGLLAVLLANIVGSIRVPMCFAYFFLEYVAVLSIFVACFYIGRSRPPRGAVWWLVPGAVTAATLARLSGSFSVPFAVHGAIMGLAWTACLFALWPSLRRPGFGAGVRIVAVGLSLLAVDYMQHLPTALIAMSSSAPVNPGYYTITSLVDGMLDFVLGLGTVIVIVDAVRAELEGANTRLMMAHQRTEEALHKDPMTGTLNRYSFSAAFGERDEKSKISGSVVVVDVNDLKRINDTHGHAAGDEAIKAVAKGLVSLVRTDDPVYRFGGDEFVVVMINARESLAMQRMERLSETIKRETIELSSRIGPVTASFGIASFDPGTSVPAAVEHADAVMYAAKPGRVV
jgi:diguanylate cyclase (GGDEF)-like protein